MLWVVKTYLISASVEQAEVGSGLASDASEYISAELYLLIFLCIAILLLK